MDLMESDKSMMLASRADEVMLCLKQRFLGMRAFPTTPSIKIFTARRSNSYPKLQNQTWHAYSVSMWKAVYCTMKLNLPLSLLFLFYELGASLKQEYI
jgi:hypothetical protein